MLLDNIISHEQVNVIESAIFVSSVFFASRRSSFRTYFIFTAADVLPCGGYKKGSPYIIIVQIIYFQVL